MVRLAMRASAALGLSLAIAAALVEAPPAAATDGRAELPRVFLDTHYVKPAGDTIRVRAGDDLQHALGVAQPGDQVVLQAGATFTGNFVLPDKSGDATIVVRTSGLRDLPPQGERAGPADAAAMARIETPNTFGAITTANGAHDWRFVGIEFGIAPGTPANTGVVRLGQGDERRLAALPTDMVIDRSWVHGNPTGNARRGVSLNGIREAVVDSYVSDFHEVGADAQAIAGWNGPGPFKIVDDFLEGSGENVMFGGADPAIRKLVPSDIEIRRNHFFKPLSWRVGDPSYAGTHWTVKNIFELKNARRVLVRGNVLENCWGDAQTGFGVNLKSADQDGTAPWSQTSDVTFRDNIVRHAASAVTVVGRDPGTERLTRRVTIQNNVFEDIDGRRWGGSGIFLQVVSGPAPVGGGSAAGPAYLVVDHNTAFQTGSTIVADGAPSQGFAFTNDIAAHNRYGVKGTGTATGTPTLEQFFPGYRFERNVIVGGKAALYPLHNFFPATWDEVGFVDLAGGDYRLAPDSPYAGRGQGGTDPGADVDALEAALGGP